MRKTFRIAAIGSALVLGTAWLGAFDVQSVLGQESAQAEAAEAENNAMNEWRRRRIEKESRIAELGSPDAMASLGDLYQGEDDAKSLEWFLKAAEAGNPRAMARVGDFYNPDYERATPKDAKETLKWYLKAYEEGYANHLSRLGDLYSEGNGIERDGKEAVKWFQLATERAADRTEAKFNLGLCFALGFGVEKDLARARRLIRNSDAEFPEDETYFRSICLKSGFGIEQDEPEAERLLRKAAEAGNPDAIFHLALQTKKEDPKFEQFLAAAESGSSEAANVVGRHYRYGSLYFDEINPDEEKALQWLRKAADGGNVNAMEELGAYYWTEAEKRDFEEGLKWYCLAAEAGRVDAMGTLCDAYEEGELTKFDLNEAIKWLQKAADANEDQSAFILGFFALVGIPGVEKNVNAGIENLEKARSLGNGSASALLGELYERGIGVDRDLARAIDYYQEAYRVGEYAPFDPNERLGRLYYRGEGAEQDKEKALNYFRALAIATDAEVSYDSKEDFELDVVGGELKPFAPSSDAEAASQLNALGVRFENGIGVEDDSDAALKWFQIAALYGSANATRNLAIIYAGEDEEKALELWTKWAELDETDLTIPCAVYYEPEKVTGVDRAAEDATKWLENAAKEGSEKAKKALEILRAEE
ncbi:MAG: sel1 repeat family protein [Thermoguttaceae bacterium]|nr:sel1 repeat family protein [Thermoguttaceae bacterium]